jgi:hypothetical protein
VIVYLEEKSLALKCSNGVNFNPFLVIFHIIIPDTYKLIFHIEIGFHLEPWLEFDLSFPCIFRDSHLIVVIYSA